MKKRPIGQGNRIKGALCAVLGHEYVVSREITQHIKEYRCIHCDKQVSGDEDGQLRQLTAEKIEINNTLRDIHFKRKSRQRSSSRMF